MVYVEADGGLPPVLTRDRLSKYQAERLPPERKRIPTTFSYEVIENSKEEPHYSSDVYDDELLESETVKQGWRIIPWTIFLLHVILTLLPLMFIVLSFNAIIVDGQAASHRGQTVMEAERLAPTVFPIVFAAVIGRLTKTYALWRAERGATIGLLELLTGSQNLAGTLQRVAVLRHNGFLSAALIVVWILSPLGGQSSSRVLSLPDTEVNSTAQIAWHNAYIPRLPPDGSSLTLLDPSNANNVYVASMLQSRTTALSPRDLWGNVKIPMIEKLNGFAGADLAHGEWIDVEHTQHPVYSSLTGITVAGLKEGRRTSFYTGSRYFKLKVIASHQTTGDQVCDWFGDIPDPFGNETSSNRCVPRSACTFRNIIMNAKCGTTNNTTELYFGMLTGQDNVTDTWYNYKLSVHPVDVESHVVCEGRACSVTRMTYLTATDAPDIGMNSESLQDGMDMDESININPSALLNMTRSFYDLFRGTRGDQPQNEAFYVSGIDPPYSITLTQSEIEAWSRNMTAESVSTRLATLINTYLQTTDSGNMLATAADESLSPWNQYPTVQVSANTSTRVPLYAMDPVYVSLTLVTSTVLLVCGFLGLFFRYSAIAPDIIGYVSTMTRDNPHFSVPTGHGMLDGVERARLLQNIKVQIAEVTGSDDVGHVALKSIDDDKDSGRRRLRRWTEYT